MIRIAIFLCIAFIFSACWPTSLSFKDGSVPPEWERFMVVTLENKAPNAPISYSNELTELIKDGVQNRVGLSLVSSESDEPQVTISGTVNSYAVTPLSLQDDASDVKNRLTIRASFEIFINAPEEEMMELNSSRFADFDASEDIGTIQQSLLTEINEQIVQDVLNKLLSNW